MTWKSLFFMCFFRSCFSFVLFFPFQKRKHVKRKVVHTFCLQMSLPSIQRLTNLFFFYFIFFYRCLNLSETSISSWSELEKLKHFPALTDVRMKDLPLFKVTLNLYVRPSLSKKSVSCPPGDSQKSQSGGRDFFFFCFPFFID